MLATVQRKAAHTPVEASDSKRCTDYLVGCIRNHPNLTKLPLSGLFREDFQLRLASWQTKLMEI